MPRTIYPPHTIYKKDVIAVKISDLIERGRKEITSRAELEKFPIGSLISYTNHENHFKYGGFITKFSNDYFIYITFDFTTRYRARYKNISKMWVGNVHTVRNDIISLAPSEQEKTNFPVAVGDIIVYYGTNKFQMKRFMITDRHKILLNWYNYFGKTI